MGRMGGKIKTSPICVGLGNKLRNEAALRKLKQLRRLAVLVASRRIRSATLYSLVAGTQTVVYGFRWRSTAAIINVPTTLLANS